MQSMGMVFSTAHDTGKETAARAQTPPPRAWGRGLLAVLLAGGLHVLALALLLAAERMPDNAFQPAYEVDLVAPGQGRGQEQGVPTTPARKAAPRGAPRTASPRPAAAGQPAQAARAEEQGAAQEAAHGMESPEPQGQGLERGGYGLGQVERPPRLLRRTDPRYPPQARRQHVSGRVLVRFLVDQGGRVREASVVEARPEGYFEAAALEAVSGWEFSPGQLGGRKVSVWMEVPISFRLE